MRPIIPILVAGAFVCACGPLARAAAADQPVRMDDTTKKATARALEWLAAHQNKDGSWSDGGYQHNTAVTAFALLAFMSQGHLPGQGQYGPEVARGCRFLLAAARPRDGYLIGAHGGGNMGMYCHAMSTLALAELWGMTADLKIKPTLRKALDLIVRCQNHEGGWRYQPNAYSDADISVTIMQVMALRAAKNSGLHVPDDTLKRAIAYIKSCHHPWSGGFVYQPHSGSPGFARTAAGMCVLQLSGEYDAEQIPKAVDYLKDNFHSRQYFWYGHYYAAHAMHQVGGKPWRDWYERLVSKLLPWQQADGSWSGDRGERVGPVYQTAIAVLALSVPMNYLPIYQR